MAKKTKKLMLYYKRANSLDDRSLGKIIKEILDNTPDIESTHKGIDNATYADTRKVTH